MINWLNVKSFKRKELINIQKRNLKVILGIPLIWIAWEVDQSYSIWQLHHFQLKIKEF